MGWRSSATTTTPHGELMTSEGAARSRAMLARCIFASGIRGKGSVAVHGGTPSSRHGQRSADRQSPRQWVPSANVAHSVRQRWRSHPCILQLGLGECEARTVAGEHSPVDMITKPVSRHVVSRHLERLGRQTQARVAIGGRVHNSHIALRLRRMPASQCHMSKAWRHG